jgi:hypothetical protein
MPGLNRRHLGMIFRLTDNVVAIRLGTVSTYPPTSVYLSFQDDRCEVALRAREHSGHVLFKLTKIIARLLFLLCQIRICSSWILLRSCAGTLDFFFASKCVLDLLFLPSRSRTSFA